VESEQRDCEIEHCQQQGADELRDKELKQTASVRPMFSGRKQRAFETIVEQL
jgi:hypothetical protein